MAKKISKLKHTKLTKVRIKKGKQKGKIVHRWRGIKPRSIPNKFNINHKRRGVKMTETKPRVFISFDYDNDKTLKAFLVGQSKKTDSPFEISDWSMKEAAPEKYWETEAERRISRSRMVIVMVGPRTHNAPGVLKEVRIARRLGKQIFQIIGYRNGNYKPVPDAGRLYSWNWENLKKLFSK